MNWTASWAVFKNGWGELNCELSLLSYALRWTGWGMHCWNSIKQPNCVAPPIPQQKINTHFFNLNSNHPIPKLTHAKKRMHSWEQSTQHFFHLTNFTAKRSRLPKPSVSVLDVQLIGGLHRRSTDLRMQCNGFDNHLLLLKCCFLNWRIRKH